jgi:hypothetical protein
LGNQDVEQLLPWNDFPSLALSFEDRFKTNFWDQAEMPRTTTSSVPLPVSDEKTVVARLQEISFPLVRGKLRYQRSAVTLDLGIAVTEGADSDLAGFIQSELDTIIVQSYAVD